MIAAFVRRPIGSILLCMALLLAGTASFFKLPVATLPHADFPVIVVQASLPGANPDTMASTVATPLERALGAISGVNEITSNSSLGSARVIVQFDLARDIDGAARDVQAAINAARPSLPSGMSSNPVYRKINPADAPIAIFALRSPTTPPEAMFDLANTVLAQRLSQISGVGQVTVGGGSLPSTKIDVDPSRLAASGLDANAVASAISSTNQYKPLGSLETASGRFQIRANDQLTTSADFAQAPIITPQGPLKISDIGHVYGGAQDSRNFGLSDGMPAVMILVMKQPGSNVIETVDRIKAALPLLQADVPPSMELAFILDGTGIIRASLHEAEKTLLLSSLLVVAVCFVYLRSWRAALIPAVAVPLSLAGACALILALGFSLNNLSVMALIVATGFVVDDAVVVLENISVKLSQGMPPAQAAYFGTKEVAFTVVSMSLSLVAVFIPILFMGGVVGRYLQEFAATLCGAILISMVVSLTATPSLCALILRPIHESAKPFGLAFYARTLEFPIRHKAATLVLLCACLVASGFLFARSPKALLPKQDAGLLIGNIQADQSISFQAMRAKIAQFSELMKRDPDVVTVAAYTGGGAANSATLYGILKPQDERESTLDQIIARLRPTLAGVSGAQLFLQGGGESRSGSRSGNATYQYTVQADDAAYLRASEPKVRQILARLPELEDVSTDTNAKGRQIRIDFDRDAMARLGVSIRAADAAIASLFAQRLATTVYGAMNQYRVVVQAPPELFEGPASLSLVHVQAKPPGSTTSKAIPLSAFATWSESAAPLSVNHQAQLPSTTVSFNLPEGVALSEASIAIERAMASEAPSGLIGGFSGGAKLFKDTLANQPYLIAAALLVVYIVLGMLYENLRHPWTILSTIPSAAAGAMLALWITGTEFSIVALIGIILLIGIVKKNAIMVVDFAVEARARGASPEEAIREACLRRYRPIMMTTMAALLGALPMAFGSGVGFELRAPLGVAISGGLLLSQLVTLYSTASVYLLLEPREPAPKGVPHET